MGDPDPATFDLSELCRQGGVTPRTIRFYIQSGLLPPPLQAGPQSCYGEGHLNRLRLIRRLQRQHLPLAEIRKQLVPLDDTAVAAWVARRSAAAKYLDRVMESAAHAQEHGAYLVAESRSALQRPSMRKTFPRERAQWDRYSLADDVELHVRRPLSRDMNRRVERLLEAARKILNDDEDDTNGGAT